MKGWAVCRMHGAGGGAPEGKRNGNYRHGFRTEACNGCQDGGQRHGAALPAGDPASGFLPHSKACLEKGRWCVPTYRAFDQPVLLSQPNMPPDWPAVGQRALRDLRLPPHCERRSRETLRIL